MVFIVVVYTEVSFDLTRLLFTLCCDLLPNLESLIFNRERDHLDQHR